MAAGSFRKQQACLGRSNKELRKEDILKKRIDSTKAKNKTVLKEVPKKKLTPLLLKANSNYHLQKRVWGYSYLILYYLYLQAFLFSYIYAILQLIYWWNKAESLLARTSWQLSATSSLSKTPTSTAGCSPIAPKGKFRGGCPVFMILDRWSKGVDRQAGKIAVEAGTAEAVGEGIRGETSSEAEGDIAEID